MGDIDRPWNGDDKAQIEHIIRQYVALINARDFDKLRSAPNIAATTYSDLEYRSSKGDSLQNHVDAFEEHCKIPEYTDRQITILDISVEVIENKNANAYLHSVMTDGEGNRLVIPGMTLVTLRKRNDEWQALSVSALRGASV